jgi:tetratricopeptide (TPR) repeat protein
LLLLDSVRDYAAERLAAAGEISTVRALHSAHMLVLLRRLEPLLSTADQASALGQFTAELDNFRAALLWAQQNSPDLLAELAGNSARLWYLSGMMREGLQWMESAVRGSRQPSADRARVLNGAGVMATFLGENSLAEQRYQECIALRHLLGDSQGLASCYTNLGILASYKGEWERARTSYQQCVKYAREVGSLWHVANALNNLGSLSSDLGDAEEACRYYEESMALFREMENPGHVAIVLSNYGHALHLLGRNDEARSRLEESLSMRGELADARVITTTYCNLAGIAHETGLSCEARRLFVECLAMRRNNNDKKTLMHELIRIALFLADCGSGVAAVRIAACIEAASVKTGIRVAAAECDMLSRIQSIAGRSHSTGMRCSVTRVGRDSVADLVSSQ